MGPSLQVCLDALEGDHVDSANGAGELHILERTSLKFLAQNCILNEAPNLTRFKISGSLPSLQLNFSDRKYKSMMRMIDVAIPKFNGDAEKNVTTRPALHPAARHTSFAQSKTKVPKDDEDEDLHISEDTASEGSDKGEEEEEEEEKEGGKDEFFDTPDIADGVSAVSNCLRSNKLDTDRHSSIPETKHSPEDFRIHLLCRPGSSFNLPLKRRSRQTRSTTRQHCTRRLQARVRAASVRHER